MGKEVLVVDDMNYLEVMMRVMWCKFGVDVYKGAKTGEWWGPSCSCGCTY